MTVFHELTHLGQGSLDTVASYDAAIAFVCAPILKQLPGKATLHHTRGGHNDRWANVFEVLYALHRQ